jgi:hypothetical protein
LEPPDTIDEVIGLLEEAAAMVQGDGNSKQCKEVLDMVEACIEKACIEVQDWHILFNITLMNSTMVFGLII